MKKVLISSDCQETGDYTLTNIVITAMNQSRIATFARIIAIFDAIGLFQFNPTISGSHSSIRGFEPIPLFGLTEWRHPCPTTIACNW